MTMLPMRESAASAEYNSRARGGANPARFMPVLNFSQTVSGRRGTKPASMSSWLASCTTIHSPSASTRGNSVASKMPSSSRIGASIPPARSVSASSRQATAKPSATPASADAQATAPCP